MKWLGIMLMAAVLAICSGVRECATVKRYATGHPAPGPGSQGRAGGAGKKLHPGGKAGLREKNHGGLGGNGTKGRRLSG